MPLNHTQEKSKVPPVVKSPQKRAHYVHLAFRLIMCPRATEFSRQAEQVPCATTYPNGEFPGSSWATNGHHPTRVFPSVVLLERQNQALEPSPYLEETWTRVSDPSRLAGFVVLGLVRPRGETKALCKRYDTDGSESKPLVVGQKRGSIEVGEKSEAGHKRVKMRDLESVFRSEGIDTHYPKSWKNRDAIHHLHSTEKEMSQVTKENTTMNSSVAQSARMVDRAALDLNANVLTIDDGPTCIEGDIKLSSLKKQETQCSLNVTMPRGIGLDLNAEDVSSSVNDDPFYPYKNIENAKSRDGSECASSCGEEKDPMVVWKQMKQNGFLSSSHGGVPIPKPRGRKIKNDGNMKKKMELAKKEQVDRFARIAAPSGLLNGLNPGIINHVRNSKQVHSIIEALVRSEKHENRYGGNKPTNQTKVGIKDLRGEDGDSSIEQRRMYGKTTCLSQSNLAGEEDLFALKFSSCTTMASENTSSLSNEGSGNVTSVTSLSVKAANVASQWLELLHQDIKGRLAALRRSKRRVRSVIQTELPLLMSKELPCNQENNDPFAMKTTSTDNASVDMHRARWSGLFDQMDKALFEEEKQLESWLNQVKEMLLHCERGLFQYSGLHGLPPLGSIKNDQRPEKADNSEEDLAVSAAAASIYSTCRTRDWWLSRRAHSLAQSKRLLSDPYAEASLTP
ncbi:hypothetical protein LguiB_003451 [Lonicera macranthoides]